MEQRPALPCIYCAHPGRLCATYESVSSRFASVDGEHPCRQSFVLDRRIHRRPLEAFPTTVGLAMISWPVQASAPRPSRDRQQLRVRV